MDIRDRNHKELFIEYIRIALREAEGFIEHQGLGYDGNKTDPMVSMVRLFKSWGWIVGTGIPLGLVEAYEEPEGLNFAIPCLKSTMNPLPARFSCSYDLYHRHGRATLYLGRAD